MTNGAQQWTDLALRSNTQAKEGYVPISDTRSLCDSPDIIPMRGSVKDPRAAFSTGASWQQSYSQQVWQNEATYVYVRAKNWASRQASGEISVYAVPASIVNFAYQWIGNPLPVQTAESDVAVMVSADKYQDIAVTSQPFYWVPPPPLVADHYCLVALVDTVATPNPLLHTNVPNTFSSLAELLTQKLYAAWKNVIVVSARVPVWTYAISQVIPANAGTPNTKLRIGVNVTSGLVGGEIAFSSGDSQGFDPPIAFAAKKVTAVDTPLYVDTTPGTGTASTIINISFWKGSSNPTFQDRATTYAYWIPANEEEARPFVHGGAARPLAKDDPAAADTAGWAVPVGELHFVFSEGAT